MALTANREVPRYVDQELRLYKVLGGAHIYKGALVGIDRATGYARPLQLADAFAGIAYEEADNTAGANGAIGVRLYTQGDFLVDISTAQQASIGRPVFALADDQLSLVNSNGATYIGSIVDVPSLSTAILRIQSFGDAQVLRAADVPLSSLTSAATTNPVLITHKAILVLSAEVIFNTKPDQGTLSVGTDNTTPTQIVDTYDLASLTNNVKAALPLAGNAAARGLRIWAKVTQAASTAGVGGLLTLRYIELP